jgi:hypothetical protein
MPILEAGIPINARSSTVWDVITDAGNYTVWDSGITEIHGDIRNGGTIRIRTTSAMGTTAQNTEYSFTEYVTAVRKRAELIG